MQSKFENAIVKATYGDKTRKWKLGGASFTDLLSSVRAEFGIESAELRLKYKDLDGDYIELASDEDLALAVELEHTLKLVASNDSEDIPKSLSNFRTSLTALISNANELFNSLDTLSLPEKKSNSVNTRDAVSSPVKSEAVATIDPSVLEEVYLNDGPNGTVPESKPLFDNGIQSFPTKNNQFNDSTGFGQHQPTQNHAAPQATPPPVQLPPSSNFGQAPQQQFASLPPSSGFGQTPSSGFGQSPQQLPPASNFNQMPPVSNFGQTQSSGFGQPAQQQFSAPPSSFNQVPQQQQLPPVSNAFSHSPSNNPGQQPPTSMPLPPSGFNQPAQQQFSAPPSSFNQPAQQQQLPPASNFGQVPPVSSFGQTPSSGFGQSGQLPPQLPPSSFSSPGGIGNPFQRPSSMSHGQPPSSMPPTSAYGQQRY